MRRRTGLRMPLALSLPFALAVAFAQDAQRREPSVQRQDHGQHSASASAVAVAEIQPLSGSSASGKVRFEEKDAGVRVTATINGLDTGEHGFHVHEGTSCMDYGDHYNPGGAPHGSPLEDGHHVGDMGNLVAENGEARYEGLLQQPTLAGPRSIVGHAVIVHRDEDEFIPQPSGSSGPEIGCGIIRIAGAG